MSNSLATVHPELIVEWSDRNLPLTPDSVTFGSNKKVWWKGACGHEWETSIQNNLYEAFALNKAEQKIPVNIGTHLCVSSRKNIVIIGPFKKIIVLLIWTHSLIE